MRILYITHSFNCRQDQSLGNQILHVTSVEKEGKRWRDDAEEYVLDGTTYYACITGALTAERKPKKFWSTWDHAYTMAFVQGLHSGVRWATKED